MTEGPIILEKRNGVAWMTFNRPEVRNAFNLAMYDGLFQMCDEVNGDRSIKVMVVSGAGGKGFGAGGDIAMYREHLEEPERLLEFPQLGIRVVETLDAMRVPTIAAIAGPATGGGASFAISCDLRVASPSARFGFPIARLGNCLSMPVMARLLTTVGRPLVLDMILTARLLDAKEAHDAGIFGYLTPDEDSLMARAEQLAAQLASNAPLTMHATRESLRRLERRLIPQEDAEELVSLCMTSRDFAEGVRAFVEKRSPTWRGD